MVDGMKAQLYEGNQTLQIVGESYYIDNLKMVVDAIARPAHYEGSRVRVPCQAILVAETDNPYDDNAISVWVAGHKVGHLSREDAEAYRPGLLTLREKHGMEIALEGVIVGTDGIYGVFLSCDPEDFGLKRKRSNELSEGSQLRTGLSAALGTDEADDSYDLSWMDELPSDTARRIPKLRQLLEEDPDPIDRHYMFLQLEKDLYSCRDLWESALDEYDAIAERHHIELIESMRAALLSKFGSIPLIDTYRQACIRTQKAQDWEGSLRWAERGLEIYGENAARPEAVEDLQKRAAKARDKLA
jgi:hypothetical protein